MQKWTNICTFLLNLHLSSVGKTDKSTSPNHCLELFVLITKVFQFKVSALQQNHLLHIREALTGLNYLAGIQYMQSQMAICSASFTPSTDRQTFSSIYVRYQRMYGCTNTTIYRFSFYINILNWKESVDLNIEHLIWWKPDLFRTCKRPRNKTEAASSRLHNQPGLTVPFESNLKLPTFGLKLYLVVIKIEANLIN